MANILFDEDAKGQKHLPTPKELAKAVACYNKEQWNQLCEIQEFMDVLLLDTHKAKILAEIILAGKYKKNAK